MDCLIGDCVQRGRHGDGCADGECPGCRPAPAAAPWRVCQRCADRIAADLATIGERWAELPGWLERGSPPAGPRVSGGGGSSLPLVVDVLDLGLPARQGSMGPAMRGVLGDVDQLGGLSVATDLDFWARDWAGLRRESLPAPEVPVLVGWLSDRLDWALEHHLAVDEFASVLRRLAGHLRRATGDRPVVVERLSGVECRHCGRRGTLFHPPGEPDRTECGACGDLLNEGEYYRWTGLLTAAERRREVRAQDILTVLNDGEPVDVDRLEFAVVTKASEYRQGRYGLEHTPGEQHDWPFARGEIMVLDRDTGREPFGEGRKPGKWDVEVETAATLADARKIRARVLAAHERAKEGR